MQFNRYPPKAIPDSNFIETANLKQHKTVGVHEYQMGTNKKFKMCPRRWQQSPLPQSTRFTLLPGSSSPNENMYQI